MHRVVIIGGGFGGLQAAQHLRDAPVQVTLVDRRNFHLFQPLVYQVATGALSPAEVAAPLRSLFKDDRNVEVILGEVTTIDVAARKVVVTTELEGHGPLSFRTTRSSPPAGPRTRTSATRSGGNSRQRSSRSRAPCSCAGTS